MSQVRPFPFDRLQRLTAEQALLLDRASRFLAGRDRWSTDALEAVVGGPLQLSCDALRPGRADRRLGEASQLLRLEQVESARTALVEVDSPLALELVWLSLTGALDPSIAAPRPLDHVEQGVLLYLAARVLWSLFGPRCPMRLAGLASEGELAACEQGGLALHLTLSAGEVFGHAWLHLPPELGDAIPTPPLTSNDARARALRGLPTALHAQVGRAELSLLQWRALRPGDVVLLDQYWLDPPSGDEGGQPLSGQLRLRLPGGEPRWRGRLTPEGAITLSGPIDERREEMVAMEPSDDTLPGTTRELLEEIPVELSVELGRVAMTAGEAIGLCPGQTLRLGRRPGDLVDLRVGPKLVGRGELVQIEGEVGLLIRELFNDS